MKLAILSDIHGNKDALDQVLQEIERLQPDRVVCLGDCIGYGPEPQEVIDALRERQIPIIIGNHELAACDRSHLRWFNPNARQSLLMSLPKLKPDTLSFLRELPKSLIVEGSFCVHGFPPDSAFVYLFQKSKPELQAALAQLEQRICFVSHTHDLEIVEFDGQQIERRRLAGGITQLVAQNRYFINVGSVGQPRDGSAHAKYVLWNSDLNCIDVRVVHYDNHAAAQKILLAGLPEEHARRLRGHQAY